MKICIASLFDLSKTTGGIQTHCKWLIKFFKENGIDYIYVSPFCYNKIIVYPVFAVRYLFKKRFKLLSTIWYRTWHYYFLKKALVGLLKKTKLDIINAQCPLSALAALEIRSKYGYRYQIILRVGINRSQAEEEAMAGHIKRNGRLYKKIKKIEEFVFSNVDRLIFVSNFIKKTVIDEYPYLKDKPSAVIYNGVGDCFKNTGLHSQIRDNLDTIRLINIGTLEPRKNQAFLLKMMERLTVKFPHVELHLIGDGEDRQRLKNLANSLGLDAKVKLRGYLSGAQQYMKNSYLYLHSSLAEGLPFALIEAMSFGIPAISFPAGGIPEVILHGYNGFLVEEGDIDTYVEYIEELITDRAKYERMRQNCLKLFQEKFTYQAMGNQYLEFYKNALNS